MYMAACSVGAMAWQRQRQQQHRAGERDVRAGLPPSPAGSILARAPQPATAQVRWQAGHGPGGAACGAHPSPPRRGPRTEADSEAEALADSCSRAGRGEGARCSPGAPGRCPARAVWGAGQQGYGAAPGGAGRPGAAGRGGRRRGAQVNAQRGRRTEADSLALACSTGEAGEGEERGERGRRRACMRGGRPGCMRQH